MRLAKIRHRIIATILDNSIIFIFMAIILLGVWPSVIYAIFNGMAVSSSMIIKIVRCGMFYALILLLYYMVIPIFLKGQTIGKWVFKLKIVTDEDEDVDYKILFFREAICRILIRTMSLGISSIVSILIMLTRDDKKSLSDVFAKTKVIDIKEEVKWQHHIIERK